LLHLQRNIDPDCQLALEIYDLVEFHLKQNVYQRTSTSKVITQDFFCGRVAGKFQLLNEIRSKFLGIGITKELGKETPNNETVVPIDFFKSAVEQGKLQLPKSVFEPLNDSEIVQFKPRKFLFNNVEIIEDTTKGQRNFMRNVNRMLN
jgi:hypothetical protein